MLWIMAALLTLISAFLIARPLLKAAKEGHDHRADYDVAVFKDQLAELEEEHAEGLIDDGAHEAAKLEIQRRLLAAAQAGEGLSKPLGLKSRRILGVALAVLLALSGAGLYALLGSPGMPDRPYIDRLAQRLGANVETAQNLQDDVARLTERLGHTPKDASAWLLLGRAQRQLGRHAEGAQSLRQALLNGERDPEVIVEMAESQVYAAQGEIASDVRQAFETALLARPDHPKALYFLGLERLQENDAKGALKHWNRLLALSQADAPWLPMLKQRIAEAEARLSGKMPAADGGAPDVGAMLAKLEARLKANPKDAQGWTMLGRSYAALGDIDKARDAYGRALELSPADLDLKQAFAVMLYESASMSDPKAKVPVQAAKLIAEVLAADPQAMDALFIAGQAALDKDDKGQAKALWSRLLEQLDPQSADYADLKKMIGGL